MQDSIWLIGGGLAQQPIAEEIKRRDFNLIVTDGNKKCPVRAIADEFYCIDTYNEYDHAQLARSFGKKVKAVLTDGADVGNTVSCVAEGLELPAEKYDIARIANSKVEMRKKCKFTYPLFITVGYDDDPENIVTEWQNTAENKRIRPYPCIVKPADNCASRGVSRASDSTELISGMKTAFASRKRQVGEIIIEQMLSGKEVAMDFFATEDDLVLANASCRLFYDVHPITRQKVTGLESGHVNPFIPPYGLINLALETQRRLGITFGPFKLDVMFDAKYGWCVIETATRLGGAFDHAGTAVMGPGREVVSAMVDVALGMPRSVWEPKLQIKNPNGYAALYAPIFHPGSISGWDIPDTLNPDTVVHVMNPTQVPQAKTCADRPLFVLATGHSANDAWENAKSESDKIQPIYVEFRSKRDV